MAAADPHRTQLWLIRHGETAWSRSGAHTGRTDLPLTENGARRAEALGRLLGGRQFALVLASPLQRARETTGLAASEHVQALLHHSGSRKRPPIDLCVVNNRPFSRQALEKYQAQGAQPVVADLPEIRPPANPRSRSR